MRSDKEDMILRKMTEDDVPPSCLVLMEYLNIDLNDLSKEAYYVGDGLDLFRYLIKHLGGLPFRIPRVKNLQKAHIKYLQERKESEPDVTLQRLIVETKLDEKTVRRYLSEINK